MPEAKYKYSWKWATQIENESIWTRSKEPKKHAYVTEKAKACKDKSNFRFSQSRLKNWEEIVNAFDAACKRSHVKMLLKLNIQIAYTQLIKITHRNAFRKKFLLPEFQSGETKLPGTREMPFSLQTQQAQSTPRELQVGHSRERHLLSVWAQFTSTTLALKQLLMVQYNASIYLQAHNILNL